MNLTEYCAKNNIDCEFVKERMFEAVEIKKNNPELSSNKAILRAFKDHIIFINRLENNLKHNKQEFLHDLMQILEKDTK